MSARARPGATGPPPDRGVFMISVAAELAEMHPQTLRVYEQRGLIKPSRSARNTRLYSLADVEILRRINRLTTEAGMNLAGVEQVMVLERELERALADVGRLERQLRVARADMEERMERLRRSFKREMVVFERPSTEVVPARSPSEGVFKIRIDGPVVRGDERGDAA